MLTVALDRRPLGAVAFPPYEIDLPALAPGRHLLDLTAYGNRHNAFGSVHNCDPALWWRGPYSYRSKGKDWSYEYHLCPMGILAAPMLASPAR